MRKEKHFKNEKNRKAERPWRLLAPMALALALCVVCLFGATWAWFSARVDGTVAPIQTARFTVDIKVVDSSPASAGVSPTPVVSADGSVQFQLTGWNTYEVTLTANGTAKTGYCMVTLDGEKYPTAAITAGSPLSFRVKPNGSSSTLSVEACWGVYKTNGSTMLLTEDCLLTTDGVSAANDQLTEAETAPVTTEPETAPATTEPSEPANGTTAPSEPVTEPSTQAPTQPAATEPSETSDVPTEAAEPAD